MRGKRRLRVARNSTCGTLTIWEMYILVRPVRGGIGRKG